MDQPANTGGEGTANANSTTFLIPGTIQTTSPNTFTTSIGSPVPVDVSTYEARMFAVRELRDYTQHLVGDLLTIIDAAIGDPRQNAALKRLLKRAAWDDHYTPALAWAERQIGIEYSALTAWDEYRNSEEAAGSGSAGPHPVAPQFWKDVDRALRSRPIGDTYNVFPFSRTPGPEPLDERAAEPR